MKRAALRLPDDSPIPELARAFEAEGGRLLVVGGWVRDALAGESAGDVDLEIFGLSREAVTERATRLGFTSPVGRQFPVWRHTRAGLDLAFPRAGNALYDPSDRDSLERAVRVASAHRDLTLNAIAWDPLEERLLDPLSGAADLAAGMLRAADPATFGVDPLRVLRVARLAARFAATPDRTLTQICRALDLGRVPAERIAQELRRMLLDLERPSRAFEHLDALDQLGVFAPLAALQGVPQDPVWHPEGDVWIHTCRVIDCAAQISRGLDPGEREILLFAALCHDLGKPETTTTQEGRIRSLGHEARSAEIAGEWLASLRFATRLASAVQILVAHHLAPAQFVSQAAGPRAYRRLARKLAACGLTLVDLERVARADHLGRTTEEARAGRFEAGRVFLERAAQAEVQTGVRSDVVSASFAMQRGIAAGPRLGRVLKRCREIQDETGSSDPREILEAALRSEGFEELEGSEGAEATDRD